MEVKKFDYDEQMFTYKRICIVIGDEDSLVKFSEFNDLEDIRNIPGMFSKNKSDLYIRINLTASRNHEKVLFHELTHLTHYIERSIGKIGTRQLPVIGFGDEMFTRWVTWLHFDAEFVKEAKKYLSSLS